MATPPNYQSVPDLSPYTPGAISTHEAWKTSPYGSSPQSGYSGDAPSPIPLMNPSVQQFNNTATKVPDRFSVQPSSRQQAIDTYESMSGPPVVRSGGSQNVYTDAQPVDTNDTWRDELYAERARNQQRSGSYGSGPSQQIVAPMKAMESPELPDYQPTEYKPPEEDKGVYDTARRESMGAGMRELREGTREAISSSQSLDNPNARSRFIQQALKGYGQGLEQVARGASSEARGIASRKRSEQLDIYKTNYTAKSNAYLQNYQNKINKIANDFVNQQNAQTANFNANMDPNTTVRNQTGSSKIPTGQDMYNQMFGSG